VNPVIEEVRIRGRRAFDRGLEEMHSKAQLEEFCTNRVRCYRAISVAAAGKDDISCVDALPADLDDWQRTMEFALGSYRFGTELKNLAVKNTPDLLIETPLYCAVKARVCFLTSLRLAFPLVFSVR
jgi:hypothetical protein